VTVLRAGWLAGVLTLALAVTPARADPLYQHLRLVAPAAPGGGWDQTARAMQAVLQEAGIVHTSSVENIPGAAGTIGLARFISAERGQGDVLMLSGLIMLGAVVTHRSPVTLREVTPIARLIGEFEVIVVPAASPFRTLGDLVAAFRAAPESISWGGGSAGGTDQILAGLIADAVGVDPRRVNYIAYSGGGESLSAILGGQVSVGVNGLAELAPHIEAGAVRVLAISSTARLPGLDAPTFLEQGVDVEIENWRSVVAPPGVSAAERQQLERAVEQMVRSAPWQATLERYRWSDRYLSGTEFARFAASEEARVEGILGRLGTGQSDQAVTLTDVGRYPIFVLAGLIATALVSAGGMVRSGPPAGLRPSRPVTTGGWRALGLVLAAAVVDLMLLDSAGFVVASTFLFWLTARAFDAAHPVRDLAIALALSAGAYLLFVGLLQLSLPPGPFGGSR
jgi:putative tricarboxylic transport membrane protein